MEQKFSVERRDHKVGWKHHGAKRGQDVERQCSLLVSWLAEGSMKIDMDRYGNVTEITRTLRTMSSQR